MNFKFEIFRKGQCKIDLCLQGHKYEEITVSILPNLCSDLIVGHDILRRHSYIQVQFGGEQEPLNICSLLSLKFTTY